MNITQLHLAPLMARRAQELLDAFPTVIFTSGRRDLSDQARAMAINTAHQRDFIHRTYLHGAILQMAVDHHPEATTVDDLAAVLYDTLLGMSSSDLSHVSDHLNGDAVDLHPMEDSTGCMTPTGQEVYTWIHNCPDTKTFLVREAGLVRWHWSVHPSIAV